MRRTYSIMQIAQRHPVLFHRCAVSRARTPRDRNYPTTPFYTDVWSASATAERWIAVARLRQRIAAAGAL